MKRFDQKTLERGEEDALKRMLKKKRQMTIYVFSWTETKRITSTEKESGRKERGEARKKEWTVNHRIINITIKATE